MQNEKTRFGQCANCSSSVAGHGAILQSIFLRQSSSANATEDAGLHRRPTALADRTEDRQSAIEVRSEEFANVGGKTLEENGFGLGAAGRRADIPGYSWIFAEKNICTVRAWQSAELGTPRRGKTEMERVLASLTPKSSLICSRVPIFGYFPNSLVARIIAPLN